MKARLVRIGNSRGLRLPKPLIDQAGLGTDVELQLRGDGILIAPVKAPPRSGWAEAARRLQTRGEGQLLDPPTSTRFDDEEWEW